MKYLILALITLITVTTVSGNEFLEQNLEDNLLLKNSDYTCLDDFYTTHRQYLILVNTDHNDYLKI